MDRNSVVYNLTLKISNEHADRWLEDMEHRILPRCSLLSTIQSTQINRLFLDDEHDQTFAIQFVFPSSKTYDESGKEMLKQMVLMIDQGFKGKYVYFATMMEVLHYSKYTDT